MSDAKEMAFKKSDLVWRVNTLIGNLNGVAPEIVLKVLKYLGVNVAIYIAAKPGSFKK